MDQSAPIIYLYAVKIITLIFGSSELTLRIFSFICFAGVLLLVYLLMKNVFTVKYPILCTAFVSNISTLLYYSNEFKPYMSDCFCVLFVLYLYFLFKQGKLKIFLLSFIYSILLWLSNPVIFFIGGVFIYEFGMGIFYKDKATVLNTVLGGVIVLSSFFVLYIYWLKPVADSEYTINYWTNYKFCIRKW